MVHKQVRLTSLGLLFAGSLSATHAGAQPQADAASSPAAPPAPAAPAQIDTPPDLPLDAAPAGTGQAAASAKSAADAGVNDDDSKSSTGTESVVLLSGARERPREQGLNPGAPRAPGSVAGSAETTDSGIRMEPGWGFQFHGYLAVPLAVGAEKIRHPSPGQSSLALHTPPQVADTWGAFAYSNVVPAPWTQLNFSYGNQWVTATVIIAAYSYSAASGWYNPAAQLGINKAFITVDLPSYRRARFLWRIGAFGNTYGHMGQYDNGRYETPIVAATNGVGETLTAEYKAENLALQLEDGVVGTLDIAPQAIRDVSYTGSSPASAQGISAGTGLCPTNPPSTATQTATRNTTASQIGPAYGWPDCNTGTSFAHHLHAGATLWNHTHLGLHWLHAWSQDDRTPKLDAVQLDPQPSLPARAQPTGYVDVYGADLRVDAERFGVLFLGANYTKLTDASTVGNVVSVLNAGGGAGITRMFLGPASRGNGSLSVLGAQYEFSLAKLLRYPDEFYGEGPDLQLALFGMYLKGKSADPTFDGTGSVKFGGEATYSPLSWLGVQGRYDHLSPTSRDHDQDRDIATARLVAHTQWVSRERFWLQYSHWFNRRNVVDPYTQLPPLDKDMVALVATMWW